MITLGISILIVLFALGALYMAHIEQKNFVDRLTYCFDSIKELKMDTTDVGDTNAYDVLMSLIAENQWHPEVIDKYGEVLVRIEQAKNGKETTTFNTLPDLPEGHFAMKTEDFTVLADAIDAADLPEADKHSAIDVINKYVSVTDDAYDY